MRFAAIALVLLGGVARADFVRGIVKIDVRDANGTPIEAKVVVTPAEGGDAKEVPRVGQVYVTDGLVPGTYRVDVAGAEPQTVRVAGRQPLGVVAVVGVPPGRGKKTKKAPGFTAGSDEPVCDADKGQVVEAVAFAHGGLAAGRLEVRRKGKLVCVATLAGGGASLRLEPGEYTVDAKFAGGGSAHTAYNLHDGKAPPPLVLRGK
jgi:hypothetical protein